MKKVILLSIILILFLSPYVLCAENDKQMTYITKLSDNRSSGVVCLYDNGRYIITNQYMLSSDVEYSHLISRGIYDIVGDSIFFYDEGILCGFNAIIRKEEGITFINGFTYMKGLNYKTPSYNYSLMEWPSKKRMTLDFEHWFQNNSAKSSCLIKPGRYKFGERVFLNISPDNRFYLYQESFLVSQGKWTQEGSILLLKDDFFPCEFYMLVKDPNTLEGVWMPGIMWDMILNYEDPISS